MKRFYLIINFCLALFLLIPKAYTLEKQDLRIDFSPFKYLEFIPYKTNNFNFFFAKLKNYDVYFSRDGFILDFYSINNNNNKIDTEFNVISESHFSNIIKQGYVLKFIFINSNQHSIFNPSQITDNYYNFFLTKYDSNWQSKIYAYKELTLQNLYPNIDLKYRFEDTLLRYDFILKPNANPSVIKFEILGADKVALTSEKELSILADSLEVKHIGLKAFQIIEGDTIYINCNFELINSEQKIIIGFNLNEYDSNYDLIIDPLIYSTYLGTNQIEAIFSIKEDTQGNYIVAGSTFGANFPTTEGAYSTILSGEFDVFCTKFSATSNQPIFSTFLGGSQMEHCSSMVLNNDNTIYLTGYTYSNNFPVTNQAFQNNLSGESDCFISKLSADGSSLLASTFLGGGAVDYAQDIALGNDNSIYVCGSTFSNNFPTTQNAFQSTFQSGAETMDAFITRLNPNLSGLIFSTFLGGTNNDQINGITLDQNQNAIVIGTTSSFNFPLSANAFQSYFNGGATDAFISKISSSGSSLLYSTYFGGFNIDYGIKIIRDANNHYIFGLSTWSSNLPIGGGQASQNFSGGSDLYIGKFNSTLDTLIFSTFCGGSNNDFLTNIAIDSLRIYLTGQTNSTNFPSTPNSFQTSNNGLYDAFLTIINKKGDKLHYSTLYGGTGNDKGNGIYVNNNSIAYIAGSTFSNNLPTDTNSFQSQINGNEEGFIAKFSIPSILISQLPDTLRAGQSFYLHFNVVNNFLQNNEFIAELSNTSGSFTQPTVVGNIVGQIADSILITIPATITPANNYKIRIKSTNPEIISDYIGSGTGNIVIITQFSLFTSLLEDGVDNSCVAIGDFNNDGLMDIFLAGLQNNNKVSALFKNTGTGFIRLDSQIVPLQNCSADWGDFNNDGFIDLIICGLSPNGETTKIYKNNGNETFSELNVQLQAVQSGTVNWVDLNQDGYLDIFLTGLVGNTQTTFTKIYINNKDETFSEVQHNIPRFCHSSVSFEDYNKDGLVDIAINGLTVTSRVSRIYRNNGNFNFTNINAGLTGAMYGSITWGDYNNDGFSDILLTGWTGSQRITKLYRFNGTSFIEQAVNLTGINYGKAIWFDYNADGLLDIILTGLSNNNAGITQLLKNTGTTFQLENSGLPNLHTSNIAIADFNNDKKIDLVLTGNIGVVKTSRVYLNNDSLQSINNTIPINVSAQVNGRDILITWNLSDTLSLNERSVSYNVNIGTMENLSDILSSHSNLETGKRKISKIGNAYSNTSFLIKNLEPGEYYCSVQTINSNYFGSQFSEQISVVVPDTFYLPVNAGWNIISSYVEPFDNNISNIFAPNEDNLILIKNKNGQSYISGADNNTLLNWNIKDAYLAYFNQADTVIFIGKRINPQKISFELNEGWNLISYIYNTNKTLENYLSNIENKLFLAKQNNKLYSPLLQLLNSESVEPGTGIFIYVLSPCTLTFY